MLSATWEGISSECFQRIDELGISHSRPNGHLRMYSVTVSSVHTDTHIYSPTDPHTLTQPARWNIISRTWQLRIVLPVTSHVIRPGAGCGNTRYSIRSIASSQLHGHAFLCFPQGPHISTSINNSQFQWWSFIVMHEVLSVFSVKSSREFWTF